MAEVTRPLPYRGFRLWCEDIRARWKDFTWVKDNYGLIMAISYVALALFRSITWPYIWLRPLASRTKYWDAKKAKSMPFYQDIGVIIGLLATLVVSCLVIVWSSWLKYILLGWLLAGTIIYHMNMLWFDDIEQTYWRSVTKFLGVEAGVLKYRRVLMQVFVNFLEFIILFAALYASVSTYKNKINNIGEFWNFFLLSLGTAIPFDFTYATAGKVFHNIEIIDNYWLPVLQVVISMFFIIVLISAVAPIAFARREIPPER